MEINIPKIAVLLPVYNGSKYLEASIYSILNQNINDFEFLVCDDCSTDDSLLIMKNISIENPGRFMILENKVNLGLFKTLNILIETSKAKLIHFWSQDDIMKFNCLKTCAIFHDEYPNISMSYHGVDYIDNTSKFTKNNKIDGTPQIISKDLYLNISVRWGCIPGNISNVTVNRTYLDKIGCFDEDMTVSGDFDLWTRLANISSIGRIESNLIYLRRHADQLSQDFKSVYARAKEDIPIHLKILATLPKTDRKKALKWWWWKTQVSYYNDYRFLKRKGKLREAEKLHILLKQNFNLSPLLFKWIVIKMLRMMKLEIEFYKKILES